MTVRMMPPSMTTTSPSFVTPVTGDAVTLNNIELDFANKNVGTAKP